MIAVIMRVAQALPVWLWATLAVAGAMAAAVAIGLGQASTIGELETSLAQSERSAAQARAAIEEQAQQYNRQLEAMGQAVAAQKGYALDAQDRAQALQKRIQQARGEDDALDACLGMPLPDGMADGLRQ